MVFGRGAARLRPEVFAEGDPLSGNPDSNVKERRSGAAGSRSRPAPRGWRGL